MRNVNLLLAAVALIAFVGPASAATYYVSQSAKTKHCVVTTKKPNDKTMMQIGTDSYRTRKEASAALKAASDCTK